MLRKLARSSDQITNCAELIFASRSWPRRFWWSGDPGKIPVNRTRSAYIRIAASVSRQIGAAVHMQGLTGDKPRILGCQKHCGSSELIRLRHAAERERACHLDDFGLAAAVAWLGCIGEPRRDREVDSLSASARP